MKRYSRIADAQAEFEKLKKPVDSETRIWGFEIPVFRDKETGDIVEGIRNYCILSISALYYHLLSLSPHRRNFYEVIYGKCHLFIDYDLAMPSTSNVNDAHAEITRVIKEILSDKISLFGEKVLVAARSPHKQSMHVKYEFFDEQGRSVVFSDPLACRRFISEVVRRSIEQRGFDNNPLFHKVAGSDAPLCVLDLSIYNPNRNFRLAGNTKAKELPEQHRGWLLPPNTPDELVLKMPSMQVFRENLATFVANDCVVLDTSSFPDIMEHVRSLIKAHGKSDPNIDVAIRRINIRKPPASASSSAGGAESGNLNSEAYDLEHDPDYDADEFTRSYVTLSQASATLQGRLEECVLRIVKKSIPANGYKIVERYSGIICVRLITYHCEIKGENHRHKMSTFCKVYLFYPSPRVFLSCKKDRCIAKMQSGFDRLEVEIEPDDQYEEICNQILRDSVCDSTEDFF